MKEHFLSTPSNPSEKEPKSPIEAAEPNKSITVGIRRLTGALPEGTYLWNNLKRQEAANAVSQFTPIEAAHMLNKSDEAMWMAQPAFYSALVDLTEGHIHESGESEG